VFHLATASHHLIYSGELLFIDVNARTQLYVVLMSDLLLLTRPDRDTGSLEVFDQPIGLQDIVGSNFMCSQGKRQASQHASLVGFLPDCEWQNYW
jgi:hypothetical protein